MLLTRFLKLCHDLLRADGIRFIVSFSDPAQGHTGGIYKAANFTHLGKTEAEIHCIDSNGDLQHRRTAYRYSRRHNVSTSEARQALGFTPVKTLEKDRWFLALTSKEPRTVPPTDSAVEPAKPEAVT